MSFTRKSKTASLCCIHYLFKIQRV